MVLVSRNVNRQVSARVVPGKDRIDRLEEHSFSARHRVRHVSLQPHVAGEVEFVTHQAIRTLHLRGRSRHLKLQVAKAEFGVSQTKRPHEDGSDILDCLIAGLALGPSAEPIDRVVDLLAGEPRFVNAEGSRQLDLV